MRRDADLSTNERRYRTVAIPAVEIVDELRYVFVYHTRRFQGRIVVTSPADEILVTSTFSAAILDFRDIVCRTSIYKHRWWWFL